MALSHLPSGPLARIRSSLGSYNGVFLNVARHLLQHTDSTATRDITTGDIARQLGTSRATIVRFSQSLGYAGFPEMKAALIAETVNGKDEMAGGELPEAAARVASMTRQSLADTISSLDPRAFAAAIDGICRAPVLYWFGIGDSSLLAGIGAYKFTRARRQTQVLPDTESLPTLAGTAQNGDVLIVISQSGRWRYVAASLQAFRDQGVLVIAITSQAGSPIARAADIVLLTACRDVTVGVGALTFRAPADMIIDMLVMESASRLHNVPVSWLPPAVGAVEAGVGKEVG